MMRMFFTGVLMACVISACSSSIASAPSPTGAPVSLSTATPELPAAAAPLPEGPGGIEYDSVAEALADLKATDGYTVEVLQGWTIVIETDGKTNWSFPPPDHPAYPAVAKRVLYHDEDGWHLKMDVLCEAEKAACDEFVRYFEFVNAPMYQYIEQQR